MKIKKIVSFIKDDNFKINYINNSVNIVNYDKILEINNDLISVLKENKVIQIRGNDLKLSKLLDDEILITGIISKIEL